MATKKTEEIVETNPIEEEVEVYVPFDPSDDQKYAIVGINGKLYQLPRGETSKVPKAVADEYNRAAKALADFNKAVGNLKGIRQSNAI